MKWLNEQWWAHPPADVVVMGCLLLFAIAALGVNTWLMLEVLSR